MYNRANIKVAMLCNHQKNISKSFNVQLKKINEKIKELKTKKRELEKSLSETETKNKDKRKKIKEKINKIKSQIEIIENKKDLKIELKNLSLNTSKTNYIDPRITVAFFKKHNLPLEKIFTKALIDKFFWAMDVSKDWNF
jgi:DNA topoisomerase-1